MTLFPFQKGGKKKKKNEGRQNVALQIDVCSLGTAFVLFCFVFVFCFFALGLRDMYCKYFS